ncbi:MAG: hypothetical protein EPO35_03845 [Acidobacteria bacterium]|nr:MAG: hypothetical protein EPO35_03845 [Acidobacteriota bacterium]
MPSSRFLLIASVLCGLAVAAACNRAAAPTAPPTPSVAATSASDGSTLNVTAPVPTSPINSAQVTSAPTLVASAATGAGTAALQYRFELFNEAGTRVEQSSLVSSPSYQVTATLDFQKNYTWRVRAEYDSRVGPWSSTAKFVSPNGGYIRTGEVFDPLYNGATVGERVGTTTFVANGIRTDTSTSYVRYLIPGSVTAGEFSVEVSGLRPNAAGDKNKVFAMSSDGADFITDPYRVDIQYRGSAGFPPNAITFRCLYGSADALDVRYEPDTTTRLNSAINLDPNTVYFWKFSWGSEVRLTVRQGSATGTILYNVGVPATHGTYRPSPWYAYIGAPSGRSGAESASTPGAIYKNVWISSRARPF